MAIEFRCECGRVLKAADDFAGRKAKCPACGGVVAIPAASTDAAAGIELDEDAAKPQTSCPNCGEMLAAGTVLCVNCGCNLRTGEVRGNIASGRGPKLHLPVAIPKGVIVGAVVVVVLAVAWFVVGAPALRRMRIHQAYSYVESGDLKDAIARFEDLQSTLGGEERERMELWIRQFKLELATNKGRVLGDGKLIDSDVLDMQLGQKPFSGGSLLIKVTIRNKGTKPLALSRDFFYVRGISDIVPVAEHEDNSVDGVVVAPGASEKFTLAFRRVPYNPVIRYIGKHEEKSFYMSFNDGTNYVKRMLPF